MILLRASARKLHDFSLSMTHNSHSPARDSLLRLSQFAHAARSVVVRLVHTWRLQSATAAELTGQDMGGDVHLLMLVLFIVLFQETNFVYLWGGYSIARGSCVWCVCGTVRLREMGTGQMGTILIRASVPLRKMGTDLLGSWWP